MLNFCANNYLGLADDPRIVAAAKRALDERGNGLSSVRFICGTQDIHKALEDKISEFHGMEDTVLYMACFDANAGLFEAILGEEDAVISDALNHASIIDGIRLCKAKRFRYNHMDMQGAAYPPAAWAGRGPPPLFSNWRRGVFPEWRVSRPGGQAARGRRGGRAAQAHRHGRSLQHGWRDRAAQQDRRAGREVQRYGRGPTMTCSRL